MASCGRASPTSRRGPACPRARYFATSPTSKDWPKLRSIANGSESTSCSTRPREGDRDTRVAALVDQRLRLHGAIIGVARAAAVLSTSSPVVASTLRARRRLLGDQVVELFAPELRIRRGQARAELAAALEATASLENVDYLRTHAGLGTEATAAVVRRTLHALLEAP